MEINLRKLINLVVVFIIIGVIAIFSINFYNKSKLNTQKYKSDASNVTTEKNSSKKEEKKSQEESENKSDNTKNNQETNKTDQTTTNTQTDQTTNDNQNVVNNEVSVESTSSEKNPYIAMISTFTIALGLITITIKLNK